MSRVNFIACLACNQLHELPSSTKLNRRSCFKFLRKRLNYDVKWDNVDYFSINSNMDECVR